MLTPNIVREEILTLFEKPIGMEPSRLQSHLLRWLVLSLCGIWDELKQISAVLEHWKLP